MIDLIKKLVEQAGLTEQQAGKAVEIMKEYVTSKVPPMFSGVVNSFFALKPEYADDDITEYAAHNAIEKKAEEIKKEATDKIEDIAEETRNELEYFAKNAAGRIDEIALKTEEAAKEAIDKLKGIMEEGNNNGK